MSLGPVMAEIVNEHAREVCRLERLLGFENLEAGGPVSERPALVVPPSSRCSPSPVKTHSKVTGGV